MCFIAIPADILRIFSIPPGLQLLQYFFLAGYGDFEEWVIYLAYNAYIFALFLPFLQGMKFHRVLINVLTAVVVFACGTSLFPDILNSLMVDAALGGQPLLM